MAHHMCLRNDKRYYPVDHMPRKRQKRDSPSDTASARQASAHNAKSILFRLPRELRDQIFEYVWNKEDDFLFRYRGIAILSNRPRSDRMILPREYGAPTWLLASNAMLNEGLHTFFKIRHFLCITNFHIESETDGSALRKPPCNNHLLFNDRIKKVGFHTHARRSAWILGPLVGLSHELFWDPSTEEEMFLSHLQRMGASDLTFEVRFSDTTERWRYDVGTKEMLKRLKRFDILPGMCKKVELDMGMAQERVLLGTLSDRFLKRTRAVMGEVAAKMVGGEDVVRTEVRWTRMRLPVLPSFRYERA